MTNQRRIEKYKEIWNRVSNHLSQVYKEMAIVDQQPAGKERSEAFDVLLSKKLKMEILRTGIKEKVEPLLAKA